MDMVLRYAHIWELITWPNMPNASPDRESSAQILARAQKTPCRKLRQGVDLPGSPARTRTTDPVINSHLLYRLSYWGIKKRGFY